MYLTERVRISFFGLSDSIRFLPVVINALAIALFPFAAVSFTQRWRTTSVLFLTVYLHVFSAPNLIRMYGLCLLTTIMSLVAWHAWRSHSTWHPLALWTIAATLGAMTHYYGAFLLGAFVLVEMWSGPRPKVFLAASMLPAIVFLSWIAYVFPIYRQYGLTANLNWVEPNLLRALAIVPFHFATVVPSGFNPIHSDWWKGIPGRQLVIVAVAMFHMALCIGVWRGKRFTAAFAELALLLLGPALILALLSLFTGPVFDSRFLLGSLPMYWLLLVMMCEYLKQARAVLATVVVIAVMVFILPLHHDLSAGMEFTQEMSIIIKESGRTDAVVADVRVGGPAAWMLRRASLPVAILPSTEYWSALPEPRHAPRVWRICQETCNEEIGRFTDGYTIERRGSFVELAHQP